MQSKLIIFDNDGVLIDSEIIWHRVNAAEMTRLGFPMTVKQSIDIIMRSINDGFDKIMKEEYGKTISDSDRMAINTKTEETYASHLVPVKNISLILDYLEENNIQKCVASNGDNEYILRSLNLAHLDKYFKSDQLFSGTLTNRRKPAPDVFLHAANHFKIKPEDCLVIEDHIHGIAAAKAAKMPVIGFLGASHTQSALHREELIKAGPTAIVENALELLSILKR